MIRLTPEDEQSAWALWLARPDKTYSYTDCTSFVLMRRLGVQRAIAIDADFQRELDAELDRLERFLQPRD